MICSTIPTLPSKATRAGLIVGAALLLTLQPLQAGFSAEVATMQSDEHRRRLLDFQRKSNRK